MRKTHLAATHRRFTMTRDAEGRMFSTRAQERSSPSNTSMHTTRGLACLAELPPPFVFRVKGDLRKRDLRHPAPARHIDRGPRYIRFSRPVLFDAMLLFRRIDRLRPLQ